MAGGDKRSVEGSTRAVGGEHDLPLERTARVRARREGADEAVERARRARRRARDEEAERRAVILVVLLFLGFGGLGFVALNFSGFAGGSSAEEPERGAGERSRAVRRRDRAGAVAAGEGAGASSALESGGGRSSVGAGARAEPGGRATGPARQSTAELDETPDLPALRHLEGRGLTAGAEGIPQVELEDPHLRVADVAGLEACRFAYGVWEFSPNQTFRFLSTCRGLGRLELIGAYEVREAQVHLSELVAGRTRWTSVFEVEKPSTMVSRVIADVPGRPPVALDVTQRITVVRGGLFGDDIRDSFSRRNRLTVPDTARSPAEVEAPVEPRPRMKSPLEELLGG